MLAKENPGGAGGGPHEKRMPLSQLRPGQKGIIRVIEAPQPLAHRLFALGIVPGTEIEVVRTAALGDPIELRVRGFRIALRKQDAQLLEVEVRHRPPPR